MGFISKRLLSETSEALEVNFQNQAAKKIDERLELFKHFPEEWQMVLLDAMMETNLSKNVFFKGMEPSLVQRLLSGFELMTILPGEFVYGVGQPSTASKVV